MEKQFKKKITWVIKNFSCEQVSSDHFFVDGCKWRLVAYPKENKGYNYLSLFLEVADYESLKLGWRIHAKVSFIILNQRFKNLSQHKVLQHWFNEDTLNVGFLLNELQYKDSGFLVNGELKIVAEVDVIEVIGKLDVSNNIVTIDVNGFQLLPSQAHYVRLIFENHSEFASEICLEDPDLKRGYMSLLLSLIDTICQAPREPSEKCLSEAYVELRILTNAGFKLDWLRKKLDEVLEKKKKQRFPGIVLYGIEMEIRVLEMDISTLKAVMKDSLKKRDEAGLATETKQLKKLKDKLSDRKALVEKLKGEALAAQAPLSFDDVVKCS